MDDQVKRWGEDTRRYIDARSAAGTPEGDAYAARLEAIPPAEAAAEIEGMFCLCFNEDLACEIACDLQLASEAAVAIANEIIARRTPRLGQRLDMLMGRLRDAMRKGTPL